MAAGTTLIKRANWVIAWDATAGSHVYRRHIDVAFAGDRITHLGPDYPGTAETVIDGAGLVVMPGLVNVHSHPFSQPLFKGVREELGNPALYMSALYDRTGNFQAPGEYRQAMCRYTLGEMMMSGATTIADLSIPYPGWVDVLAESGLRAFVGPMYRSATPYTENGHEVKFRVDEAAGRRDMEQCLAVVDEACRHPSGRLSGIVFPAQVETCSVEMLQASVAAARDRKLPLHTHAAQSVVEFHEMTRRTGKTPIEWLHEVGFLGPTTTIAHAVFLDHSSWVNWHSRVDLGLLASTGTAVAHSPTVFSRYGQVLESLSRYLEAGVTIGLGTDTHPHNLIEEMRTALMLARVTARNMHAITTAEVFHAATVGGARILGRDDIGRLAPGMKADLVLVDATNPIMRPLRDPLRSLIYTAAERAVRDVYCDGRQIVRNGRPVTIDFEAAAADTEAAQIAAEANVPKRHPQGLRGDQVSPLALRVQ